MCALISTAPAPKKAGEDQAIGRSRGGARGPVPQGHRRLRRVSPSFLSFVELPPKLFLREQRSVVNADLSDALTRNSQINHQSAVAKQLPARDIVAERTPCCPLRIGAAQIMCAWRGEEPGKARKVVHEGRPEEQASVVSVGMVCRGMRRTWLRRTVLL